MTLRFGIHLLEPRGSLEPMLEASATWLSNELGRPVSIEDIDSYAELTTRAKAGQLDIAWLPPIVYLRIGAGTMVPVVSSRRDGRAGYDTVLIVRKDSKVKSPSDLKGTRAAWVDAWSAAGYVIPRVRLKLGGLDPSDLFVSEKFYGSHAAAIQALVSGEADVTATFGQVSKGGEVTSSSWSNKLDVRVLTTFGEIPTDMIAIREGLAAELQDKLRDILLAGSNDETKRPILKRVWGADALGPVDPERYEVLRSVVNLAETLGVAK